MIQHQQIADLRARYVRRYESYLEALSGVLAEELLLTPHVGPMAHTRVASRSWRIQGDLVQEASQLREDLRSLIHGPTDPIVREFSNILADEAVEAINDISRRDRNQLTRLAVEVLMGVATTGVSGSPAHMKRAVQAYMDKRLRVFDRGGKRWKSIRFIETLLSDTLYRAYNESLLYRAQQQGTTDFIAVFPDDSPRDPIEFNLSDYRNDAFREALFHPNAECLVVLLEF
jgi:hypothetical protein